MPPTPVSNRLILASGSPYRRELLSRLKLSFETAVPEIDESALPSESPEQTAMRLAVAKARAVADREGKALIIGADQVATLDGTQIGKPGSHDKALAQLQFMRGRSVIFHSAVCVVDNRGETINVQVENVQTAVVFRALPDQELDAYLRLEQPYDCAGSAKNEGLGIAIIERIETIDPTALTGLPLIALTTMLRRAGVSFFAVG